MGEKIEVKATYFKGYTGKNTLILGPIFGWMVFEFFSLYLITSHYKEIINIIGVLCLFGGFILLIPMVIFLIIYIKNVRIASAEHCDIIAKFMCENGHVIYIDNDNYIPGEVMDDTLEGTVSFFISHGGYINIKEEDKQRFIDYLDANDVDYERIFEE